VYFLETGLVLLVAPWSTFWERNLLVESSVLLSGIMRHAVVRGAVSGVGVVNLCAGLWEVGSSLLGFLRPAMGDGPETPDTQDASVSVDRKRAGLRGEDTSPWLQRR